READRNEIEHHGEREAMEGNADDGGECFGHAYLPLEGGGRSRGARSGGGDSVTASNIPEYFFTPPRSPPLRVGERPSPSRGGLSLRRVELLPWVLHVGNRVELDVGELAVLHLGAPHVDILDDVAGIGVDHDRPARALVLPAL